LIRRLRHAAQFDLGRQGERTMPTIPRHLTPAILLLSALLIPSAAFAGDAVRPAPPSTTGSAVSDQPSIPQAPIGHRQPRAADIPADAANNADDAWLDRVNRSIDSKLTICRGC
jgi:hypothetical protein